MGAVLLALLAVTPPVLAAGGWGPTERVVPLQRQVYGVDSVIDRAGTTTAVWSRKDGDARQIMAARRPAAGEWSTPLVVENVGRVAGEPRVAADGHGRLTVVWSTMRSVQAVQRLPWGRWTDPVTIGTAPRGYAPAYLGLASNADGLTLATWELMDDDQDSTYAPSRVVAVLRQPTGSWGRPTVLTPRSQRSYRPQPAVTADGEAMLVWDSETRASGTVMFSSRWPGAGWSMARPLSPPSTHAAAPQLAVNAHGAVVVAWVAVGRFDRVQAVRRPSDGRWSPPVSLSTTAGDVWWHDVASAANGASTVGWALRDGSVHAADWKPGPGWGRPVTVAPRGSVFYELELLRNGRGDTLATWTSVSGGDHPVVTAYRPMGGAWQAPARVSQPSGDAFGAAALGPFGRAGVVWVNGNVGLTGPVYARFHQPG